jgi:CheY-like chemotaxis protein
MPRKNGRALQDIRRDPGLCSVPIVILTTSKSAEDIRLTYKAGANSFITKPAEFRRSYPGEQRAGARQQILVHGSGDTGRRRQRPRPPSLNRSA